MAFLLAGPMSPLILEVEQRYTFVYIQHTRFVNVTPIMKNLIQLKDGNEGVMESR